MCPAAEKGALDGRIVGGGGSRDGGEGGGRGGVVDPWPRWRGGRAPATN